MRELQEYSEAIVGRVTYARHLNPKESVDG
jgi:hypothetical protein